MLDRRDFMGAVAAATAIAASAQARGASGDEPIRQVLMKIVGSRSPSGGAIAAIVDENAVRTVVHGSSGAPGVELDGQTVFEIGSVTKVFTALLLTDMAARGEGALDDPLAKYLPPGVTLRERGRPITLLDLANYNAGLPPLPGNLPPRWWESPNPFVNYTADDLYAFMSGYQPEDAPGGRFVYSSLGFALLGQALARRAGKSYEALVFERICEPLGLSQTRILLSADMRRQLAQPHDLDMKPTPLWDLQALGGAGALRSSVGDVTNFLKACMGLGSTPLSRPMAQLLETRRPTTVAGTDAALGWFVSSYGKEQIAWKSGLTGGFNTFLGFSTRRRRGALLVTNFLWQPLDTGTTAAGMKLIDPDFDAGDLSPLYV